MLAEEVTRSVDSGLKIQQNECSGERNSIEVSDEIGTDVRGLICGKVWSMG